MKKFSVLLFAAMLVLGFSVTTSVLGASGKPNVLFIITDQHHANMMSTAGNTNLKTPGLDAMAKGGIRFANAYPANPVCVPSRIGMMTGVMPGRFGVLNNGMKAAIPARVGANSLGKVMERAGYDTFYGGKTHLAPVLEPRGGEAGYGVVEKDSRMKLAPAVVEFIEKKRDKPFFAVASFINPHDICFAYSAFAGKSPKGPSSVEHLYQQAKALDASELPPLPANNAVPKLEPEAIELNSGHKATTPSGEMRKSYSDRDWRNYRWIYCRLVEQVDGHIVELLEALKRNGLEENTLVVFTADHGDMDAAHRLASKGKFYEESAGVPFMMMYKGAILPGVVDKEHFVSNTLDLLPTLCDYAGVEAPGYLLGRSLRSVAEGKGDVERRPYVVVENHTGRMVRTLEYKYCVYHEGETTESLVNLTSDPGEMMNLAGLPQYKDTMNLHRGYLQQWIEESGDEDAKVFAIAPSSP